MPTCMAPLELSRWCDRPWSASAQSTLLVVNHGIWESADVAIDKMTENSESTTTQTDVCEREDQLFFSHLVDGDVRRSVTLECPWLLPARRLREALHGRSHTSGSAPAVPCRWHERRGRDWTPQFLDDAPGFVLQT